MKNRQECLFHCRSAWDMSPLCTGRHVDQWESSDMSEQSRGGCSKSLRVFPPRSRRSLRFALSEPRMHAEGHGFSRSRFTVPALRSLCGLCGSAVILILRMGFEARRTLNFELPTWNVEGKRAGMKICGRP